MGKNRTQDREYSKKYWHGANKNHDQIFHYEFKRTNKIVTSVKKYRNSKKKEDKSEQCKMEIKREDYTYTMTPKDDRHR